jgi:hypothetical protein
MLLLKDVVLRSLLWTFDLLFSKFSNLIVLKEIVHSSISMPLFEEGRAYCFVAVGRSTSSFRSFSSHWLHILKWNLVYRFIVRISRSCSVLGTFEPFLIELFPLDFDKFQYFTVSVHLLCTGFHILKWNLVYRFIVRISRSNSSIPV